MYNLIQTDGYSIETWLCKTMEEAQNKMVSQYNELMPSSGLDEDCQDLSYCCDTDAMLYANGETVYLWHIQDLTDIL